MAVTNITGLPQRARGSSFTKESIRAWRKMGPLIHEDDLAAAVIRIEEWELKGATGLDEEVFDNRAERKRGEKSQDADDEDNPDQQNDE